MDDTITKKIQQLEKENEQFRRQFLLISRAMKEFEVRLRQLGTANNALALLVDKLAGEKQIITLS